MLRSKADRSEKNGPQSIGKKLLRLLLLLVAFLLGLSLLVVLFISPLTEYLIETYDEDWTGRQVEMDDLDINLLTGTVRLEGLKIYEADSQEIFLQAADFFINLTLYKFFSKKIHVSRLRLQGLNGRVVQGHNHLNFDDLVERFSPAGEEEPAPSLEEPAEPWQWQLDNLSVEEGGLTYFNEVLGNEVGIDSIFIACPSVSSADPNLQLAVGLRLITGGSLTSDIELDYNSLRYALSLAISQFNLNVLYPYLADYLDVSTLEGALTTSAFLAGNASELENLATSGDIQVANFFLADNDQDSITAWDNLLLRIDTLDLLNRSFRFNQLLIQRPFLRFEVFNGGDNLSALVKLPATEPAADSLAANRVSLPGREYLNVFVYLADYASYLARTYLESDYTADTIAIQQGRILFSDFTLDQPSKFVLDDLFISTSQFDSRNERVTFYIETRINNAGHLEFNWNVAPKDALEMEATYELTSLPLTNFNPYSTFHTAYPFFRGDISYKGYINIHNRQLDSNNEIFIEKIEVGKKTKENPPIKVPVRLAVALLRDTKGNIDLELPVEGDLNDPKYRFWKVIWQVLENILLKAVTSPYKLLAGMFDVDESALQEIPFEYGQSTLENEQLNRLKDIAKVLNAKEELVFEYFPVNNRQEEKDRLAINLAREQYYRNSLLTEDRPLTEKDSTAIENIAPTDSLFLAYLMARDSTTLASPQELSAQLIGNARLDSIVTFNISQRDSLLRQHLQSEYQIAPERIRPWAVDSTSRPDTFNLVRPLFLLNFSIEGAAEESPDR